MGADDKEFVKKNKEKHPKRKLKAKTVFVTHLDGSNVRV